MSSINGIKIKNLKEYRGHEWESCAQGDLWDGNTKLGFWSQDSWGGPDEYEGNSHDVVKVKAMEFQCGFDKTRFKDPMMYDVLNSSDVFMGDVLALRDIEKGFKDVTKGIAPGATFTVLFFKIKKNGNMYVYRVGGNVRDLEDLKQHGAKVLQDIEKKIGTDYIFWTAKSLKDFDIQVDENHPAPEYLYDPMYCTFGGATA